MEKLEFDPRCIKRKERTVEEASVEHQTQKKKRKESENEEVEASVEHQTQKKKTKESENEEDKEKEKKKEEILEEKCTFCEAFKPEYRCVLDGGLRKNMEYNAIRKCSQKAGCSKKCTYACKRFYCYQQASSRLNLKYTRQKLPACVEAQVQAFFGASKIGFIE
jgi:hypothetical protein